MDIRAGLRSLFSLQGGARTRKPRTDSRAAETEIEECREFLKVCKEADEHNRVAAIDDLKFRSGDQWPADMSAQRDLEGRPCLTINKTDAFVRQAVNDMRQRRPRLVVHPVGGADKKMAQVIEGLMRHIEVNSSSDVAEDTAADFQVSCGLGYWRVRTHYESETSFDQEIYIDPIANPFTVYMDPWSELPDGSDMEKCVITDLMPREAFRRKYPGAQYADWNDTASGDDMHDWATKDEIRIAEYFYVDKVADTLIVLNDGRKLLKSELPEGGMGEGLHVIGDRPTFRRQVRWCKLTAGEVLEKSDWAGRWIPIIPVYGAQYLIDGRRVRYGMVRSLRDPQRMYNFWRTTLTESYALQPKAPWLVAEGQIEGYEDQWNRANTRAYSYLQYVPVEAPGGGPLPPPQRQPPVQVAPGLVQEAMNASEDMKAVAGMFDPALGAEGQETSGKMVQARQAQSDMSNFHFYDNLCRSKRHTGKILLDLIPKIYDTERVVRIIGADGKPDSVTLNQKQRDPLTLAVQEVLNDTSVGQYDVIVDTGPGYETKREQAQQGMLDAMRFVPSIGQVASDLIVRNMDWPMSDEIADRLKASNPLAGLDEQIPEDVPEEVRASMMHLMAQNQQLQQQVQQLMLEHKYKAGIEQGWQQVDLEKAKIGAATKVHDTLTRAHTAAHDAATRAVTATHVAEIGAASRLMEHHVKVPMELEKMAREDDRAERAESKRAQTQAS